MIDFKLPELGENVRTAEVIRVLVAEGDNVQVDQNVLEMESEKAAMGLPSPHAGRVARIHVHEGDQVSVGQVLLSIEEDGKKREGGDGKAEATPPRAEKAPPEKKLPTEAPPERAAPQVEKPSAQPKAVPALDGGPIPAGPATRRLARELGVNLRQVKGTGPGGRITREDLQSSVRDRLAIPAQLLSTLPDFEKWGPVERRPLSALARTAARRLQLGWQTVPQVTQHGLADITDLEAGRKRLPPEPKITITVLALKAIVAALKTFPHFNSSFDAARDELILKRYFHIGVAVDTPHGLVVPVIRDADRKSIRQLASELAELAEKARQRALKSGDLQGGAFTLSNLGGLGGTAFTPLVNYPEVAILGLARAQPQLVQRDSQLQTRLMLPLSLSYDHRVINGADGARFVTYLAELLGDPVRLLVEV